MWPWPVEASKSHVVVMQRFSDLQYICLLRLSRLHILAVLYQSSLVGCEADNVPVCARIGLTCFASLMFALFLASSILQPTARLSPLAVTSNIASQHQQRMISLQQMNIVVLQHALIAACFLFGISSCEPMASTNVTCFHTSAGSTGPFHFMAAHKE